MFGLFLSTILRADRRSAEEPTRVSSSAEDLVGPGRKERDAKLLGHMTSVNAIES